MHHTQSAAARAPPGLPRQAKGESQWQYILCKLHKPYAAPCRGLNLRRDSQ